MLNSLFSVEGLAEGGGTKKLLLPAECQDDNDQSIGEHDGELIGEVDPLSLDGKLQCCAKLKSSAPPMIFTGCQWPKYTKATAMKPRPAMISSLNIFAWQRLR